MGKICKNDEQFLVLQLIDGNNRAFRKIYEIFKGDVYAYCMSMLKSKVLAEEIVQDVFLNIWQHRNRLNPDLSFKSYVFTITRNLTFNLLKKVANNERLKVEVFKKSQDVYNPIEDKIAENEYDLLKKKAIAKLSPKRRIIFEMSRNEGKSYEEISKELNISINTVKVQMSKSLTTIRDFLIENSDITMLITLISSDWLT